jgi:hypothetical protein
MEAVRKTVTLSLPEGDERLRALADAHADGNVSAFVRMLVAAFDEEERELEPDPRAELTRLHVELARRKLEKLREADRHFEELRELTRDLS